MHPVLGSPVEKWCGYTGEHPFPGQDWTYCSYVEIYSVGTYNQIHFPKHQFLLQFEMPQAFLSKNHTKTWVGRTDLCFQNILTLLSQTHFSFFRDLSGWALKSSKDRDFFTYYSVVVLHHSDWFCLIFFLLFWTILPAFNLLEQVPIAFVF